MRESSLHIRPLPITVVIFGNLVISGCSAVTSIGDYATTPTPFVQTINITSPPAPPKSRDLARRPAADPTVSKYFNLGLSDVVAYPLANVPARADFTEARLRPAPDRIDFGIPSLAPVAHTRFCQRYPADCTVRDTMGDNDIVVLSERLWDDLLDVNRQVNQAISPEPNNGGLAKEWLVSPKSGDCSDYAVTKRHELLARGWPSRALLLAEVTTAWGEHHLVLVVRTQDGDLVLDNINPNISAWSQTPYQWLRVQSPNNPKLWSAPAKVQFITRRQADRTAGNLIVPSARPEAVFQ